MSNFLKDWQLHSTVLAAARQAKRKPSVWALVPIGLLVYIAGTIAAVICLIPILAVWVGLGGSAEQAYPLLMSNQLALTLAMNLPIMAGFIGYMRWIEKRSLLSAGFTRNATLKRYLAGLGWGTLMMLAAAGIACAFGGLRFAGFGQGIDWLLWLLIFIGFLIQGMSEEVMCRGFLMVSAANRAPLWIGVALNSVLFAALHLFNQGVTLLSVLNLILYALFASFYFLRTDSIWGIGALHAAWNFVQGCVLGVGVSGNPIPVTTAYFVPTEGSAQAINGGTFGLEGSIAATIVLVAGILLLVWWPYNKDGRKKPQAEIVPLPFAEGPATKTPSNRSGNRRPFRILGWLITGCSLAGMAGCVYDAFWSSQGCLLPFIGFALTCVAGICLIVDSRKKSTENAAEQSRERSAADSPQDVKTTDNGTAELLETKLTDAPKAARANVHEMEAATTDEKTKTRNTK